MVPQWPYKPFDITVSPLPDGFLIGRVLPSERPGPWWEYIETVPDLQAALKRAKALADHHGTRAWVYTGEYTEIPDA
jgi:hypothetical protein